MTGRTRRAAPADLPDLLRSAVPLGLILLAALVRETRPFVLAALVAGVVVAIRRDAPVRWSWAAPIPVAVSLCWGLFAAPVAAALGSDCGSAGSSLAGWRAAEAALVLGALAVLAVALHAHGGDLGLRMPRRSVVQLGLLGAIVMAAIGLPLVIVVGHPGLSSTTDGAMQAIPGILGPAIVFALANGVMEELAYRGTLVAWSGRVTGTWLAVVVQAVVYGVSHGAIDANGPTLPTMAILGVGALVAGAVAVRTRSLLVPIAWHVALALPVYAFVACAGPSAVAGS